MTNITIDLVYNELKHVRKELEDLKEMHSEVHALRYALIPEEEASEEELAEIRAAVKEMREGKAVPWRRALKK